MQRFLFFIITFTFYTGACSSHGSQQNVECDPSTCAATCVAEGESDGQCQEGRCECLGDGGVDADTVSDSEVENPDGDVNETALDADEEVPQTEPLRVGVLTPLTGDLAELGASWGNAAILGLEEVNAAGGLLNAQPLEYVLADDGTQPESAEERVRELVATEGLVAIIGPATSAASLRVAHITNDAGIIQISGTAGSAELNIPTADGVDSHPNFYRTVPSDALEGAVIAALARGEYRSLDPLLDLECDHLGIFHVDDPVGTSIAETIAARFTALGGDVAARVPYEDGWSAYRDEIRRVIDAAPDCLALIAWPNTGGRFLHQWSVLDGSLEIPWIGTHALRGDGLAIEGGDRAEGVLGTEPQLENGGSRREAFETLYSATFGEAPAVLASAVYDAALLIALAIEAAGGTNITDIQQALLVVSRPDIGDLTFGPDQISDALTALRAGQGIDYAGASGPVDFWDNGDVTVDVEVWRSTGGDFASVSVIPADHVIPR